jgi:hypothetical protein
MQRLGSVLLTANLALCLPAAPASATVIAPLDLAALVDHADRVALVEVESSAAHWTSDHSAIYTDVTVRVLQPLKGVLRAGDHLVVRREGGELDGLGMLVSGAARFAVGEQAVVFLEKRGAATWTVGMAQGRLPVTTVAGRRVAVRDVAGLSYTGGAPPEPAVRPLEELLSAIAARVRAGQTR